MQLPSMLSDIKTLIDDNTKVICLLNGLGHVETMEEYLPKKNIFIGVTMWTAGIVGPGHIHISGDGGIELQNIEKGEQEAGKEIVEIFSKAGLKERMKGRRGAAPGRSIQFAPSPAAKPMKTRGGSLIEIGRASCRERV